MTESWTQRWMDLARLVATWSKDKSRQVGAVIVDERDGRNDQVSMGWNGFPRGVNDSVPTRHLRPEKYKWTEHAERNAIYNAAAKGYALHGCSIYLPWYPCADCARAIIQSGLAKVIAVEPDWNDPQYCDDFNLVCVMFEEAGVSVRFVEGAKPPLQKPHNELTLETA